MMWMRYYVVNSHDYVKLLSYKAITNVLLQEMPSLKSWLQFCDSNFALGANVTLLYHQITCTYKSRLYDLKVSYR